MRCWALVFAAAKAVELTHIPPMPDIDQISTDEVAKAIQFAFLYSSNGFLKPYYDLIH